MFLKPSSQTLNNSIHQGLIEKRGPESLYTLYPDISRYILIYPANLSPQLVALRAPLLSRFAARSRDELHAGLGGVISLLHLETPKKDGIWYNPILWSFGVVAHTHIYNYI